MANSVLLVVGTRPEAIKTAPVVLALRERGIPVTIVASGQHDEILYDALGCFSLEPDVTLDPGETRHDIFAMTTRVTHDVERVIERVAPAMVLVQGDTVTTFAAALAGSSAGVPVAHIEAGLRTGDFSSPYPEEMHRVLLSQTASLHFAPTVTAFEALLREGVDEETVWLTGNPVLDALDMILASPDPKPSCEVRAIREAGGLLVTATAHRRESHGAALLRICDALIRLVDRNDDVHIAFVLHPNPVVREAVIGRLSDRERITLLEPLGYRAFLELLGDSVLAISDSGGVQEEAPALGVPVVITRDTTERPEVVEAGFAVVAGRDPDRIVEGAEMYLNAARNGSVMQPERLFGDGRAGDRIAEIIVRSLEGEGAL